MVSHWSWLLISALLIRSLFASASDSCEIGFGELLQIDEIEKEGNAVDNQALRPRGAKPVGTGNFAIPEIVRGRPVNAQSRPPPRTVTVRAPGQQPRRQRRDPREEYDYEPEEYQRPRQQRQRRQREEPEYYPEEQYYEEERQPRQRQPRQRQDHRMEQQAAQAPRTQRIRVIREQPEMMAPVPEREQRARQDMRQDRDRRGMRQPVDEEEIMDRRAQRHQQAMATRDRDLNRAERRLQREQQMQEQFDYYEQQDEYYEEPAPRPRQQHRQRRERQYQEDEVNEYEEYTRQQQQRQQRRQPEQQPRPRPQAKQPQVPQVRDENQILQEALRLMEQGQPMEEEEPVQQESLVLEEWNGDEEEDVEAGGFFQVNDLSEEPRDRRGQPQDQRMARPSPTRPHRIAQAAGKEQRKPAAARGPAKVPAKKPAHVDPRFLQIAERKTPIPEGQYVEEFEVEEKSEDSGIGSGSVYVPFPQWMDFMNQVDNPSSCDLHFNVPQTGMHGDAKDIFTHLTDQGKDQPATSAGAAVEAIAKRIQNNANTYRR